MPGLSVKVVLEGTVGRCGVLPYGIGMARPRPRGPARKDKGQFVYLRDWSGRSTRATRPSFFCPVPGGERRVGSVSCAGPVPLGRPATVPPPRARLPVVRGGEGLFPFGCRAGAAGVGGAGVEGGMDNGPFRRGRVPPRRRLWRRGPGGRGRRGNSATRAEWAAGGGTRGRRGGRSRRREERGRGAGRVGLGRRRGAVSPWAPRVEKASGKGGGAPRARGPPPGLSGPPSQPPRPRRRGT